MFGTINFYPLVVNLFWDFCCSKMKNTEQKSVVLARSGTQLPRWHRTDLLENSSGKEHLGGNTFSVSAESGKKDLKKKLRDLTLRVA